VIVLSWLKIRGGCMGSAYPLNGRVILLVEDDPLIALELADLCKSAGAQVISACSLGEAAATIQFR
jgi:hypothetical protein